MLARLTAMVQDVGVGAATFFKGVGKDRHSVKCFFIVDRLGEVLNGGGEPDGVEGDGAEGVAEDVAKQSGLLLRFIRSVFGFIMTALRHLEINAQHGMRGSQQDPPIRYEAVEACLVKVCEKAQELGASVHMPRIGCGLAGGRWELIEPLIIKTLYQNNIPVIVYDF